MQIRINVGGQTWIVDEAKLLNWLYVNAVVAGRETTVVREISNDNKDPRTLLHG